MSARAGTGDFLALAGLEDLLERGNLPPRAQPVGAAMGPLAPAAAEELGLDTGCLVAPGLIDAYAGALGALGAAANTGELGRNLALIGGTSSCLVAFSQAPLPGRSLWGPYFEAGYPGHWLVEGANLPRERFSIIWCACMRRWRADLGSA